MKSNASGLESVRGLELEHQRASKRRNVSTVSAEGDAEAVSSARPAADISAGTSGAPLRMGERATTAFSVRIEWPRLRRVATLTSSPPRESRQSVPCRPAASDPEALGRTDSSLRAADFLSGRSTHPHRMVQSDPTDAHGNLFPIFLLSLIQFFLVPITLWRVGSWAIDAAYGDKEKKGAAASAVAAPTDVSSEWGSRRRARGEKPGLPPRAGSARSSPAPTCGCWRSGRCPPRRGVHRVLAGGGGRALRPVQGPERARGCGRVRDQEGVPRALAAVPSGQEPDPEATRIFTEQITPAYKTLTDDAARENYEKYGHPDGKQAPKLGVALPQWMFGKDGTGPIVLIALVAFGILGPLFLAVCAITRMNRYAGSNGVLRQTQYFFARELKPHLSAGKAARVLSVAMEYINIPYRREHDEPIKRPWRR